MSNIHKVWGERRRILLTDTCEIDLLYTKKNSFCSTHNHVYKINKFIVIKGRVRIETDYGKTTLKKNENFTVEPPLKHRFVNLTDSIIIELAYVNEGKISPGDIIRYSQGGKIINGKEITLEEINKK